MARYVTKPSLQVKPLLTVGPRVTDSSLDQDRRGAVMQESYDQLMAQNVELIRDLEEVVVGQGKNLVVNTHSFTLGGITSPATTTVTIGEELQSEEYGVIITRLNAALGTTIEVENRTKLTFDVTFGTLGAGTHEFSWLIIY